MKNVSTSRIKAPLLAMAVIIVTIACAIAVFVFLAPPNDNTSSNIEYSAPNGYVPSIVIEQEGYEEQWIPTPTSNGFTLSSPSKGEFASGKFITLDDFLEETSTLGELQNASAVPFFTQNCFEYEHPDGSLTWFAQVSDDGYIFMKLTTSEREYMTNVGLERISVSATR